MGQTYGKTQLPAPELVRGPGEEEAQAFRRGLAVGRDYAGTAARKVAAWVEEHPGQALLAGLAAGFVLGKLLLPRRRRLIEEAD